MTTLSQINHNNQDDEVSLKELIISMLKWVNYLLSKWFVIILMGILGGLLGFSYAYFKRPIFNAATTFVLEDEKQGGSGLGSLAGLASIAGVNIGGGGGGIFQGDNILELYKSRKMIEKTLLSPLKEEPSLLLIDKYIDFKKLKKSWENNKSLKEITFKSYDEINSNRTNNRIQDSIIGTIVSDISKNILFVTKPDKKLSIIKVEVKTENEVFSKDFNDQIVENVNDFYKLTKTKKSLDNLNILQHKTDSVRAIMNGSIYAAASISDATPNLNPTRQTQRVAPIQKAQFSAETNKAVLGELIKNLEMSKMALLRETPLLQVVDKPIYPLEKERVGKLKSIIIGGILFGFFTVVFLILIKIYKNLLTNE